MKIENTPQHQRNEYHIKVVNETDTAVELLSIETGLSKQKVKLAMQKGAVWITEQTGTHRLRRKSKKLHAGDTVHFYHDAAVLDNTVDDALLIADEGSYSVWYKPRGMLSQGSKWGDHCAINRWVEQHLHPQRPAFIVHRLDRFASGLILIAHKKKIARALAELFQKKMINKQYKVIVYGQFPEDGVTYKNEVDSKPATSYMTLLKYDAKSNKSLLQVNIETGRKHQIRVHLATADYPVVGDRLLGNKEEDIDLQLTAYKLSFICPVEGIEKNYILDESLQPKLT